MPNIMKLLKIFLLISLIYLPAILDAQQSTSKLLDNKGPYLGQKPPGENPEIFASGIVSTKYHEHSRLNISNDGSEIFWAAIVGNEKDKNEIQKIWHTRKLKNGYWTKPIELSFDFEELRSPVISPDGEYFYFITNDPNSDKNEMPPKSFLWRKKMGSSSLKEIELVKDVLPVLSKKMIMSYSFASNRNLYFDLGGPNENGKWSWQVYFSEFKGGKYSEPALMDGSINEGNMNQYPFVAPDESYLIFSSRRDGNYGYADLYISFKDKNGNWLKPINMGPKINVETQTRSASVSPDGKYLFFTRHNIETLQDFYWVDAKIIDELKSECFSSR